MINDLADGYHMKKASKIEFRIEQSESGPLVFMQQLEPQIEKEFSDEEISELAQVLGCNTDVINYFIGDQEQLVLDSKTFVAVDCKKSLL